MLFTSQHFSTLFNTSEHFRTLFNISQHSSTLPSGSRSIGQVQHFWVEPERSFWRRKSLFLLQLKWEVRSTSTSTYIANAMLKNNIVGRINNYPGPFKYFWSFQFFWALQLIFKRVLDRALRYPQLSFIKTPVEAFDTQMHTHSNASYVLFFFFRSLVITFGNWGRCYWWYVFVRTCASRSTQHAEIIQHMLENLAMIALHKLCNTCSKKRHNMKGENGRGACVETASPCGQTLPRPELGWVSRSQIKSYSRDNWLSSSSLSW